MNRADSAFDEAFRMQTPKDRPKSIRRCKTASSQRRASQQVVGLDSNDQISTISTIRPASEKIVPTQRAPTEPRRTSTATTASNSTKSRRRGHGSAPSSRRTSCTVIDPSRPTRHYRINSSQTCPTANRDIDDVLALHFRSCSLFQNPTYQPSLPSPTLSTHGQSASAEISATQGPPLQAMTQEQELFTVDEKEAMTIVEATTTTTHWMSPSTRKKQYEKIDRANNGFRGLWRRIMPRCLSGPGPQQFFCEDEKSDAGSVRRFRMDCGEDDEEAKSTAGLRMQRQKLERSTPRDGSNAKRFGCF